MSKFCHTFICFTYSLISSKHQMIPFALSWSVLKAEDISFLGAQHQKWLVLLDLGLDGCLLIGDGPIWLS